MFSMFDKKQENKAEQILASDQVVIKKNFGIFHGDVHFIKISPDKEDMTDDGIFRITVEMAADLLNHLDEQPRGRQPSQLFNFFANGNFILSRTDQYALNHHHLYAKTLHRPVTYMRHLLQALQHLTASAPMTTTLSQFLVQPIRQALGMSMFELDTFPIKLSDALNAFSIILDDSSQTFEGNVKLALSANQIPKEMLHIFPSYRNAKNQYLKATTAFLSSQREVIFNEIKRVADNQHSYHLIALTIIELIKETYPWLRSDREQLNAFLTKWSIQEIDAYLKHPDIISIPASITAGDNLMIILSCAISSLYHHIDLCHALREELDKIDLLSLLEKNDIDGIKKLFDEDAKHNGLLHRIYLEAMRRESIYKSPKHLSLETLQVRYTEQNININHYHIPANSTIIFLPAMPRFDKELWSQPELFNPDRFKAQPHLDKYPLTIFSASKRQCPAHHVTSYMFKLFLAYVTMYYDLQLDISNGTRLSQIKLTTSARPKSQGLMLHA